MKHSRLNNIIRRLQLILLLLFFVSMPLLSVVTGRVGADTNTTVITTPCPTDRFVADCEPPRLQELEVIAVRLLYAAWACGGIIFMVMLVLIGYTYMTSAGDQGKVESARKRGGQWIIGFLLFFFSQPIVATLMKGLISGNTTCFKDLTDPGFTFFFNSVCTNGDNPAVQPTASNPTEIIGPGSPTPAPAEVTITSCTPIQSRLDSECSQICGRNFGDPTQPGCRNAPSLPCSATSYSSQLTAAHTGYIFNNTPTAATNVHVASITCTCNLGPTVTQCTSVSATPNLPALGAQ